jgi:hypothetical protein
MEEWNIQHSMSSWLRVVRAKVAVNAPRSRPFAKFGGAWLSRSVWTDGGQDWRRVLHFF